MQHVAEAILQAALEGKIQNKQDLQRLKRKLCSQYKLSRFPSDVEILAYATDEEKRKIGILLQKSQHVHYLES